MGRKLPFTLLFSCLILIPLLCGFGTGTGGSGITALPNPDLVTLEVVKELSGGGDDFAGMSARLDAVYQANPAKTDAFFLKSIIDFFAFLRRTAMDPDPKVGVFKNLYSRMGLMNPYDHNGRGNFWNFELVETNHNQGNFPVGAPTLDEAIAFVDGDLRKEIENLIGDLKKIPTGFFYLFQDLSVRDTDFGIILGSDIQGTYSVDYGDVQILVVTLEMFLAQLDLGMAYKWDNLDPNDFDEGDPIFLDPVGQIVNKYKLCGTGRDMNRLAAVIQHMKDAFTAYKNAAGHILNETSQQQSTGIFTIDPAKFKTPQERQDFLNGEKYFRQTWTPGLLNAVATNQGYLVQYAPDGSLLADTATINFYKFFYDQTGLDLRGTYLKTITNPHDNLTEFGVTDLKNLTVGMCTFGGILEKFSGVVPLPGDLQTRELAIPMYTLLNNTFPTTVPNITVDGNLGEWQKGTNCILVATTPACASKGADFGEILAARDANNLYLAITKDISAFFDPQKQMNSIYAMEIGDQKTTVQIRCMGYPYPNFNINDWYWGATPAGGYRKPTCRFNGSGAEIAVPLANFTGTHLKLGNWCDIAGSKLESSFDWGFAFFKVR